MIRRLAREVALQALFQIDFTGNEVEQAVDAALDEHEELHPEAAVDKALDQHKELGAASLLTKSFARSFVVTYTVTLSEIFAPEHAFKQIKTINKEKRTIRIKLIVNQITGFLNPSRSSSRDSLRCERRERPSIHDHIRPTHRYKYSYVRPLSSYAKNRRSPHSGPASPSPGRPRQ